MIPLPQVSSVPELTEPLEADSWGARYCILVTCLDSVPEGGGVDGAGADAVHPDAPLHEVHGKRPGVGEKEKWIIYR